jgi:hypothetical protein
VIEVTVSEGIVDTMLVVGFFIGPNTIEILVPAPVYNIPPLLTVIVLD